MISLNLIILPTNKGLLITYKLNLILINDEEQLLFFSFQHKAQIFL